MAAHSGSLVSSIKKRIFVIFERILLPQSEFEPGTPCTKVKRSTIWSTQASLELKVHLVVEIVDAAIASRSPVRLHQGYNSIGWLLKTFLLENSRPTACYFQGNSWKLWCLVFRAMLKYWPRSYWYRLTFLNIFFKLLENSRPTACYFQWNSWKLQNLRVLWSTDQGLIDIG